VTVAGDRGQSAVGRVSNISNSGISVALPFQLAAGEMVEIEIADSTLYGHVIYSRPDGALIRTGIEASRVMYFIVMALKARRRSRCTTPVTGSLRFTTPYLR
jgi:hypothetical protein